MTKCDIEIRAHDGVVEAVPVWERDGVSAGQPIRFSAGAPLVRQALFAAHHALNDGLSECHADAGKPCGTCEECRRAEARAFTHHVLSGLELPPGDLSDRLRNALEKVIGMPRIYTPECECDIDEIMEESRELFKGGIK